MKFQTKYLIDDYVGKQIGYLIPTKEVDKRAKDGSKQWEFKCICGKTIIAPPYRIISGHVISCGCMRYKNIVKNSGRYGNRTKCDYSEYLGQKKHKLTVIGFSDEEEKGRIKLKCLCDCGKETYLYPYQFKNGKVQSCGCARTGHHESLHYKKHGLCKDKYYSHWLKIKSRCYIPSSQNYERYGGRGIIMCDEWEHHADAFIKWCYKTNPGDDSLTIDRIDNDGPYAPWNCRWATSKVQSRNKRSTRNFTYNGKTQCLTDWANEYNMCSETLRGRLNKGWSIEKALTTPVKHPKGESQ